MWWPIPFRGWYYQAHGGWGHIWKELYGWHGAVAPADDPTGGSIDPQPTKQEAQRLVESILVTGSYAHFIEQNREKLT